MSEIDLRILELNEREAQDLLANMKRIENLRPTDPEYKRRERIFLEVMQLEHQPNLRIAV